MRASNFIYLAFFVFLLTLNSAFSSDLFAIEANIFNSTGDAVDGSLIVEIWDAASSGNLIYNSTNAFDNNITSGKVDVLLGAST
ncbi:MAG: hypothetical protein KKG75_02800, partial [Nanoarchaeota archaeon]|nr:hypothetical protein [Nanoarchaeota archaeon]